MLRKYSLVIAVIIVISVFLMIHAMISMKVYGGFKKVSSFSRKSRAGNTVLLLKGDHSILYLFNFNTEKVINSKAAWLYHSDFVNSVINLHEDNISTFLGGDNNLIIALPRGLIKIFDTTNFKLKRQIDVSTFIEKKCEFYSKFIYSYNGKIWFAVAKDLPQGDYTLMVFCLDKDNSVTKTSYTLTYEENKYYFTDANRKFFLLSRNGIIAPPDKYSICYDCSKASDQLLKRFSSDKITFLNKDGKVVNSFGGRNACFGCDGYIYFIRKNAEIWRVSMNDTQPPQQVFRPASSDDYISNLIFSRDRSLIAIYCRKIMDTRGTYILFDLKNKEWMITSNFHNFTWLE